jgi:exopolysaccharide biosynthesis polyprenyl glycosylphosphotransferase
MLKERAGFIARLAVFSDFCLVTVAFLAAYYVRKQYGGIHHLREYLWILLPALPVWYYSLSRHALHVSMRRYTIYKIVVRLFSAHLFCLLAVSSIVLFFDRENFSRSLLVLFVAFSFVLLVVQRIAAKMALSYARRKGHNLRFCLVVGTQNKALELLRLIEEHSDWGLRVSGFIQVSEEPLKDSVGGHKVLGHLDQLIASCVAGPVDEVVFCIPNNCLVDIEPYLFQLEELGITVRMVLDFYELDLYRRDLSFFGNKLPILTFHSKSLDAQQLFLKRFLDVVGALVGLVLTALLLPFIAIAIKINSPGPLFFGQLRVGENGRVFRCWKFRSMFVDAEQRKAELVIHNEMKGAIFKMKDDPRITTVGKLLRKTSLDELPQFWNVLKGEMSLVGTRPPTPGEVEEYQNWHRRRISIQPGITGLWQVSGRNQIEDFDEVVKLDLSYIDNWTLWLDVKILLKTVWVVFKRDGSC